MVLVRVRRPFPWRSGAFAVCLYRDLVAAWSHNGWRVMERIRADEVGTYLRGKMGLVVGPGFTINPGVMAELSSHLASEFGVERRDNFLETGDRCLEAGIAEDRLRDGIRQF